MSQSPTEAKLAPQTAAKAEADVTPTLQSAASENGAEMVGLENRVKTEESLAGSEPVPAGEQPRSTQPPRESAREQAQAARAVEEGAAQPRTPDNEFAEFEKWLKEVGATGPLTSDKLVQLYRHGSRVTVAKYLRRYLMKQVAKEGKLELGEFTMKIEPGVPLETRVDAFVKRLEGAHSMPQSFGNKRPNGMARQGPPTGWAGNNGQLTAPPGLPWRHAREPFQEPTETDSGPQPATLSEYLGWSSAQ